MTREDPTMNLSPEDSIIKEYNLRVIKPPQEFKASPINPRALIEAGINDEDTKDLVASITKFLNLPIIIDQFDRDHTARRKWRSQVGARYGENGLSFLKSNKLRVNRFEFLGNFFGITSFYSRRNKIPEALSTKLNSIEQKYNAIVTHYASMGINEKIEAMRKLDELLLEILELLKV